MSKGYVTRRQKEALAAVSFLGVRGAGAHLGISEQTVKNHLWKLYRNLEVRGMTNAMHELGWVYIPVRYTKGLVEPEKRQKVTGKATKDVQGLPVLSVVRKA